MFIVDFGHVTEECDKVGGVTDALEETLEALEGLGCYLTGVTHVADILFRPEATNDVHVVNFAFCWNQRFTDEELADYAGKCEDDRDVWVFDLVA